MCNSFLLDLDINIAMRRYGGDGDSLVRIETALPCLLAASQVYCHYIIVIRWKSACKVTQGLLARSFTAQISRIKTSFIQTNFLS